jgi:hypothetical protein
MTWAPGPVRFPSTHRPSGFSPRSSAPSLALWRSNIGHLRRPWHANLRQCAMQRHRALVSALPFAFRTTYRLSHVLTRGCLRIAYHRIYRSFTQARRSQAPLMSATYLPIKFAAIAKRQHILDIAAEISRKSRFPANINGEERQWRASPSISRPQTASATPM